MTDNDLVFVETALLGTSDIGAPITFEMFLKNVQKQYSERHDSDGRVTRRLRRSLRKPAFYCNVINTHKGRGRHWLHASAVLGLVNPLIKIVEPYTSTLSSHVNRKFKKVFAGEEYDYKVLGHQEPGTLECGYISCWYDITTRLALEQGATMQNWEPGAPTPSWNELVNQLLRIRDVQYELNLPEVDAFNVDVASLFRLALSQGKITIQDLLSHCAAYSQRLRQMLDA